MPEICFYEPWTYQLALPEKFEQILEETKKKRISYEADHCSQYNTRTQGKSAKLHPPTLSAVLKLIAMQEQKEPEAGAAGIQNVENSIRYFCMEYPLDEEVCVMTYNFRNGRFCGIRKKKDPDGGDTTKMPGVLKGGSTGEEYLAMLAFASIVSKSRYYDDEFHEYSYFIGKEAAGQIIRYVQKHSTETKSSSSVPTISGTVTEIGDGYMIVDNTALCRSPKAGKEYKVYTDDIRVKRWIESGEIKTGDLVAVEYEGEISGSCEVTGAYSIFTGTLEENDILSKE